LFDECAGSRIRCVYGIRVLAMCALVLAHTYLLAVPHITNLTDLIDANVRSLHSQIVLSSGFHVDTFFLLSALLTSFAYAQR
jgi:hypothetical protein